MLLIIIYKGVIYKTLVSLSIDNINRVVTYAYYWKFQRILDTKSKFVWVSTFVTISRRKYWVLILGGGGTTQNFLKNTVSHLWSCIL